MSDHEIDREERAIYAIIAAAGSPVLIAALIKGGAFDSGTTISLMLVVAGLIGVFWRLRGPACGLPRARTHHSARTRSSPDPSRKR